MCGCITRKEALAELFKNTAEIIEVYVNTDFDEEKEGGDFLLKLKYPIHLPAFLAKLQKIFDMPVSVGVGHKFDQLELRGKRLLWYKGKLYV